MAKIYRKRGNKLNEVVTFDSACTRQENQPLVYDATDGSVHTTTHINCLDANDLSVNNLTVTGQAIIQEQVTDTIGSNTLVLRSNANGGLTGTENSGVIIHNYNGSEDLYAVTDNTGTFRVGTAASTITTYAYLRYNEVENKWYSTAPGVTPAVEVTPVGSPTSWDSVVTSGDDVEYTNIVFSVIDRTSLEPLTTRDESTNMEADYLTKWNSTNEKIITTGTSCTHDLCANGDITSTGDITADGNVCVKTNITVDGNSCIKGDSTVSGEIHSCKCITAPTACVSDDLYVAGDINNCNTDSIIHGYYGCFEKNVCIKGNLAIDGVATLPGLVSDCVASVENTTNSSFYLSFVEENHLVKGANDLYTNGSLKYNPGTAVLWTKTFCSDRGIVQSAISGVTADDLGLTAGTAYSLETIVSCLQACCGDKAVSYLFSYANATNPKVTEYGNDYAYHLTFEKLDNNGLSGTYTKSRWLVTGANGVSWTVTGTTGSTAGSITWTVCEHVVDQVCVSTALTNDYFPLIFSTCQSTPSCSKKTLYTDSANQLMYNPSTNTLKTECVCACCDSYHARINSPNGNTCYAAIKLDPVALGENTAHLTFDVYGTKFELGVREIASSSTGMSITYFTKTGNYGITCANVTTANSRDIVYIKYNGYRVINITSDIPIKSITKSSTVPSDVSSTSWCEPTYDNATQYVNVTNTNDNFPILFNNCQATPAAGCKTLYNDSANNLMYNPSTNTLTTGTICATSFCGNAYALCACPGTMPDCSARIWSSSIPDEYAIVPNGEWRHYLSASRGNYYTYYGLAFAMPFMDEDRFKWRVRKNGTLCPIHELIDNRGDQRIEHNLRLHDATDADITRANANPKLIFENANCTKNGCLVFTEYDTYLSGASLTFVTNQPNSWFCSQYVKSNTDVTCSLRLYHCDTATNWQSLACVSFGDSSVGGATHCSFLSAACPDANGINIAFGQNAQTIIYAGEIAASNFANFMKQNGSGEKVVLASDSNAADIVVNLNGGLTCERKWSFADSLFTYGSYGTGAYVRYAAFRPINKTALSIDIGESNSALCGSNMFVAGQTNTVKANNTVVIGQNNTNGDASTIPNNVFIIGTGNNASYCNCSRCNVIMIGACNFDCSTDNWTTSLGFCNINYGIANVSIGYGHKTYGGAIAIGDNGSNAKNNTTCCHGIRIGSTSGLATVTDVEAIAIGTNTNACGCYSIAIGCSSETCKHGSIAIGPLSKACCFSSISIGSDAQGNNLAIGPGAKSENLSSGAIAKTCIVYSTIFDIFNSNDDSDLSGLVRGVKHGRIKFVIPSLSCISNIRNFFDKIFSDVINKDACMMCWTRTYNNTPTLRAELSGYYWNGAIGSGLIVSQTASGRAPTTVIHEKIYLDVSDDLASSSSICQLINSGCHVRSASWSWTGSGFWECGMVGVIEF